MLLMQENVTSMPTIVERQARQYRRVSRYSVHTCQPTMVGWSWHTLQHYTFVEGIKVEKRIEEIKEFYKTKAILASMTFLQHDQV